MPHIVCVSYSRKIATGRMAAEDKKRLRFCYEVCVFTCACVCMLVIGVCSLHMQCVSCEDPVYLHPSSSFLASPPDYVIYQELTDTSRVYMRGTLLLYTRSL